MVIKDLDIGKGGAERLFVELARLLQEMGHRVTCLYYGSHLRIDTVDHRALEIVNLAHAPARAASPLVKSRSFRRAALAIIKIGYRFPWMARFIWHATHGRFTRALARYFAEHQPDVAVSFLPPANTPTLVAAQGTGVKVVPTNHNVPALDYDDPNRWDPNPVDRQLRLAVLDDAAAIHVLFERFASWFPAPLRGKIVVIPNYVSPAAIATTQQRAKEKVIVAAGRLATAKNYATLIDAWAMVAPRFPDWCVEIHGGGPLHARLAAQIRRLDLQESVHLAGYTAAIGEVYARAAIFCHPALHEGFGLSVAEALALKVPVVAFADCAGVNEFVRDDYNGLLVERRGGATALAEGLARLIESEPLRLRLGGNGPASIAPYNIEAYRARWQELLDRLID